ncbi:hypothetical protein ACFYW8_07635 [Streptomyces sp. NPDC002742]|uniref:hypothetical protein n=1 Tax=Streptomyces sp. NPDC002742 TaxID=3364663 RepID=UPI00367B58E6
MPTIVAVHSTEEYAARLGERGLLPVLGDHTRRLERLIRARHGAGTLHRPASRGPGRVVVGLGSAGAMAGACHAAHSGSRLIELAGLDDFKASLLGELPSSVTVVGLAEHFGPAAIRTLQRELTDAEVPWGVLTGRDLPALSWVVAKQHLYRGNRWSRHLSLSTLTETTSPAGRAGPLTSLRNEQITPDVLRRMRSSPHDFLALSGHGDQADLYLHGGWLCSRDLSGAAALVDATRGDSVMRCCAEQTCYRARIHEPETGLAAERSVLVPAGELLAGVLFLNSCYTLLAAPGYRYRLENSLLTRCVEGMTGAVIATEIQRRADPAEALLVSGLLWSGHTAGVATLALNRLQADCFTGSPVFVLFGDPDLTIGDPPADTDAVVDAAARGDMTARLPSSASHVTYASLAGGGDGLRAEPAGEHRDGRRAFVVPVPRGREIVVVSDRGSMADDPVVRLGGLTDPAVDARGLRLLQDRLTALTTLPVPVPDDGVARVAHSLAAALRAVHLPPQHPLAVTARERATAELTSRLALTQGAAVQRMVREWSDALGGPMMAVDEERVVYDAVEETGEDCHSCGSPLFRVTARDVYLPRVERALWLCPSCTVVADVPADAGRLEVFAPQVAERKAPFPVSVRMSAPSAGLPGTTVVGAAVLGARGRCRPGVSVGPGPGPAGHCTLRLYVHADAVPGTYNLRVVIMDDLACSFHLQPISLLK